jgi:hypothetical protein
MVKKASSKKTTAKKGAAKGAAQKSGGRGNVKLTPSSVAFTLNAEQKQQAKRCLAETGQIRLSFKEVSVTKLSGLADAIIIVN